MIRLVKVELSRLLHRRAVLLLIAAAIAVPVAIGVGVAIDTRPPSAEALAEAERQVERDRSSRGHQREIKRCIARPEEWGYEGLEGEEAEARCREDMEPRVEWYLWSRQLDLAEERDGGSGIAVAMILALTMLLVGTTFIGHDWSSGSVSNQLLFEPRRIRVWAAKAIAVTGVALTVAAAVASSYWLALGALARSRDIEVSGQLLLDCLQMGWRTALVAALAGLVGFALTNLFRNTVATLGILFGISLAGGIVLGVLGVEGRWNPAYNVAAVVLDGQTYYEIVDCAPVEGERFDEDMSCSEERTLSLEQGSGYVGGTALVVSGASLLLFRRRDVP